MVSFKDKVVQLFTGKKVLHTPYGTFNLAKSKDKKQLKGIIAELHRTTDALTRKDVQQWRKAWQTAINVENPNRQKLYDIYTDVEVDCHLSGCIGQRKGFVLAKEYKLVDNNDKENEDVRCFFDQTWFKQLCKLILDTPYYGHSLIELGDPVYDDKGIHGFSGVTLIPRKFVIPEYGRVVTELGNEWKTGIAYRESPFADMLIEVGTPYDLGLFLKAALQTIPKKNMLAFWDTFGEIFGMPMRIARTTSRDPKEQEKLEHMLRDSAAALYAVTGMDTEIEFVENSKGDAYNVYDQRIDRANSEISKLIIGQTMTIEDGSSLSQSQTHLEVFENLVDEDRDMLRDVINNQLLPKMVKYGFPVQGLTFQWDDTINYTPEQQLAFETAVADRYEVDGDYFAEKYGMPVGERRQQLVSQVDDDDDDDVDKKKKHNNARPFFD